MSLPLAEATLRLLARLRQIVGQAHVLVEAADTAPFLQDWRGRYRGEALCVIRPATAEEVASVVVACAQADVAIVPQGGNTGLVGGGVPSRSTTTAYRRPEVLVSLTRLKRIRNIDPDNNTLTIEAGCTLQQAQAAAESAGRLFPLSLASEGTATIGGNLSTNAGGVQVLRYGNMRELTLGLEVVLPDGRLWNGLRGLRKDNTGYDLKQLFIGAEGTLGLITAATLKLFPEPKIRVTAWLAVKTPRAAVELLGRLRQTFGERITAFEIANHTALELVLKHIPGTTAPLGTASDWQVLLQLDDVRSDADEAFPLREMLTRFLSGERDADHLIDAVIAHSETQAHALWKLRESISEAQKIEGFSIKHDVSVPISRIADFIEQANTRLTKEHAGLRIVCFGHIGDGNLHYNPSSIRAQDNAAFIAATPEVNRCIHDIVHGLGGSISAEHGLGQLKREEILRYKSGIELDVMQTIKKALDPRGIMNPGKLLP